MKTKPCRDCREDIPKKANRCKHCGAKQPVHFWNNPWFYVLLVFLTPSMIGMGLFSDGSPSATSGSTVAEETTQLELQSWNWGIEHGYAIANGEVRNTSGEKLKNIEALVRFYAEDGTFISSSSALLEYQTLLPGQTSPFTVMESQNPLMQTANLSFKTLFGGQVSYKKKEE